MNTTTRNEVLSLVWFVICAYGNHVEAHIRMKRYSTPANESLFRDDVIYHGRILDVALCDLATACQLHDDRAFAARTLTDCILGSRVSLSLLDRG